MCVLKVTGRHLDIGNQFQHKNITVIQNIGELIESNQLFETVIETHCLSLGEIKAGLSRSNLTAGPI